GSSPRRPLPHSTPLSVRVSSRTFAVPPAVAQSDDDLEVRDRHTGDKACGCGYQSTTSHPPRHRSPSIGADTDSAVRPSLSMTLCARGGTSRVIVGALDATNARTWRRVAQPSCRKEGV